MTSTRPFRQFRQGLRPQSGIKRIYFAGKVDSYRDKLFKVNAPMHRPAGTVLELVNGAKVIYGGPSSLGSKNWHGYVAGSDEVLCSDLPHQMVTEKGSSGPFFDESGERIHPIWMRPELLAEEIDCDHNGTRGGLTADLAVNRCLYQIDTVDAVHAYIDTLDCFGTIAELGYAAAKGKPIYLVIDSRLKEHLNEHPRCQVYSMPYSELWFLENLPTVKAVDVGGPTFISHQLVPPPPRPTRVPVPSSLRVQVFERDNYRCCMCGASARDGITQLELDHIHPVSKGGTNELRNLQTLCRHCNSGKGDRILSALPKRAT